MGSLANKPERGTNENKDHRKAGNGTDCTAGASGASGSSTYASTLDRENASFVDLTRRYALAIAYNQEDVRIRFMIPIEEQDARTSQRGKARTLERALREGDCGLVEAEGQRYAKLYVEHKHQPDEFTKDGYGEIMHLAVQYTMKELQRTGGETAMETEPGKLEVQLTLLDFVYVPLEQRSGQKEEEPDSEVRWTILNLHKEQWRPFSFGTLPNWKIYDDDAGEEHQELYQAEPMQWATATTAGMRDKDGKHTLQSNDCVRYAAWPIQAYIKGFSRSASMRMTIVSDDMETPDLWRHVLAQSNLRDDDQEIRHMVKSGEAAEDKQLHRGDLFQQLAKKRNTLREVCVDATLKIYGGTVRDEGSDKDAWITERWEPEDDLLG
ncbi:hypothetical protein OPV22_035191 [Ensete ventricosum]|uniref:Uncharacterized protein n=1 Tax=Ensete ventricosum TaxID=4639 RepID=A0AAX5NBF4_ENSVE|nr:hypothetical protein OPV22_035191 [Ensete ventricosum]